MVKKEIKDVFAGALWEGGGWWIELRNQRIVICQPLSSPKSKHTQNLLHPPFAPIMKCEHKARAVNRKDQSGKYIYLDIRIHIFAFIVQLWFNIFCQWPSLHSYSKRELEISQLTTGKYKAMYITWELLLSWWPCVVEVVSLLWWPQLSSHSLLPPCLCHALPSWPDCPLTWCQGLQT